MYVDMHSHILFDADDGPTTLEQSYMLLQEAVNEGVTHLISTCHVDKGRLHVEKEEVYEKLATLQRYIETHKLPLSLYAGQEITLNAQTAQKIMNEQYITLANSRYVLIELPNNSIPSYAMETFSSLLAANYLPIIAHPEKNLIFHKEPAKLEKLIRQGIYTQITTTSLTGQAGRTIKKFAWELLERQMVHFIASDVHDLQRRTFHFQKAFQMMRDKKYDEYMTFLLENNRRIIQKKGAILLEPQPKRKKWWQ